MYKNPRNIKTERFKLSLSEVESEVVEIALEIDGGQRAAIARDLLMNWARTVIDKSRHLHGRASLGVVDSDGEIKYRFAA